MERKCILQPMESEYQSIPLNNGVNTLGRSKESGIKDVKCSKRQLELDVNLEKGRAKLRVLGLNPSSVNGLMVMHDTECEVLHGDVLEIIYGKLAYELVFKPTPDKVDESNTPKNENNDAENMPTEDEHWDAVQEHGRMMIFTSAGVRPSEKIAAYDIDGTIIKTKSGNVFPKHIDDWQLNFPEIPKKLQRLHENGYKICFFTNQSGIATGSLKLDDFKEKVRKIIEKLKVPIQVYIAIDFGYYRKPKPGMWEYMRDHKNGGLQLQVEKCFFVGDAAGRPEIGSGVNKRKKDHSLADRLFAANLGVAFYTPEEHFLGKSAEQWSKPEFDPSSVHDKVPLLEPIESKLQKNECEMIIMVGLPGSGKSHFVHENLAPLGYTIANADTLGSTKACVTVCERALSAGQSCVVDNTNVDVEARKKFIELATRLKVSCRCFVMSTTLAQAKHNIEFRELIDTKHSKINVMVFNGMKKRYKTPTLEEGIEEIVCVNVKPKFRDAQEERLYKLYLVEK